MIKKKYLISDIEVTKSVNGESVTKKAGTCFTEDSFIVINMPTFGEKLKLQQKFKATEKDPEANYAMICDTVAEVNCKPLDSDEILTTFDEITVFADGTIILDFLASLIINGYVPKKRLTV